MRAALAVQTRADRHGADHGTSRGTPRGADHGAHRVRLGWLAGSLGLLLAASCGAHEAIGPAQCEPMPALDAWLALHVRRWEPVLSREPGYERPDAVAVCRLEGRTPFADNRTNRVYVRRLETTDDEVTLAHEFLHLAFQHYPSGHDERYVERTARRLIAAYP
jgi:hypothetical protein